jgi:hypothetical protein
MRCSSLLIAAVLGFSLQVKAQDNDAADSLGLPGDNFDLYGALDLFKSSSSLEDFEKKINESGNAINNLDLDQDGNVDYIRVVDNMDGDAHAIQLQDPVSESETQDIAAIEIEKTGPESANLQIVGDEELYGEDFVVEPADESSDASQQKFQEFRPVYVMVNVWFWAPVRFIYAPAYVVWVSPWHYRYYPGWYHPWHPVAWHVYRAHVIRYHHPYYHCVHVHRVARAHAVYHAHRAASPAVHRRYEAAHQRRTARPANGRNSAPAGKKAAGGQKGGGQRGGRPKGGAKSGGPRGGGPKGGHGGGGKHR